MPRTCPPYFPAQYFDNIEADSHSPDALKDECCTHLLIATDIDDCHLRFETWRESALREGKVSSPPITLPDGERLGHLRYRDNYADELAAVLNADPDLVGIDASDLTELLNWLFGEPTRLDPVAAQSLFSLILQDRQTERSEIWLFRTASGAVSFGNPEAECLPWRLGLKYVSSKSRYIGFDVDSRGVANARIPTFPEVDWVNHEYWRPNGKTHPLAAIPGECQNEGLDELIAGPPIFGNVTIPLPTVSAR